MIDKEFDRPVAEGSEGRRREWLRRVLLENSAAVLMDAAESLRASSVHAGCAGCAGGVEFSVGKLYRMAERAALLSREVPSVPSFEQVRVLVDPRGNSAGLKPPSPERRAQHRENYPGGVS